MKPHSGSSASVLCQQACINLNLRLQTDENAAHVLISITEVQLLGWPQLPVMQVTAQDMQLEYYASNAQHQKNRVHLRTLTILKQLST